MPIEQLQALIVAQPGCTCLCSCPLLSTTSKALHPIIELNSAPQRRAPTEFAAAGPSSRLQVLASQMLRDRTLQGRHQDQLQQTGCELAKAATMHQIELAGPVSMLNPSPTCDMRQAHGELMDFEAMVVLALAATGPGEYMSPKAEDKGSSDALASLPAAWHSADNIASRPNLLQSRSSLSNHGNAHTFGVAALHRCCRVATCWHAC
jgi:hypothetical protein